MKIDQPFIDNLSTQKSNWSAKQSPQLINVSASPTTALLSVVLFLYPKLPALQHHLFWKKKKKLLNQVCFKPFASSHQVDIQWHLASSSSLSNNTWLCVCSLLNFLSSICVAPGCGTFSDTGNPSYGASRLETYRYNSRRLSPSLF
jgi:hypothetical protein